RERRWKLVRHRFAARAAVDRRGGAPAVPDARAQGWQAAAGTGVRLAARRRHPRLRPAHPRHATIGTRLIDIIIPVYKGASETRRCIESVLASMQREAFETVVVDDASPDANI